jgi:hypothetical protein
MTRERRKVESDGGEKLIISMVDLIKSLLRKNI